MKYTYLLIILLLSGCQTLTSNTVEKTEGRFIDSADLSQITYNSRLNTESKTSMLSGSEFSYQQLVNDPHLKLYLLGIKDKLLVHWPIEVPYVDIHIDTSRGYKALSTQNSVVVSMGLLSDSNSEAEVAFVIAHELSHILLGHNSSNEYFERQQQLIDKASELSSMVTFLSDLDVKKQGSKRIISSRDMESTNGKLADIYATGLAINRLSRDVISSSISREHEDEADLLAIDLLVKAGFSPSGYTTVMQRMDSSEKFTELQLAEKKEDFQSVVTIASKNLIPEGDSMLDTIGYFVLNESATLLLQDASERHRSPMERSEDLTLYVQREYRKEKFRPVGKQSYNEMLSSEEGQKITNNYWAATEAERAMNLGFLDEAEALAKKAVTGPTKGHAYPRLIFSKVRHRQGQLAKSIRNLELIDDWQGVSLESYIYASRLFQLDKQFNRATRVLDDAEEKLKVPHQLLPERVALAYSKNNKQELSYWLSKCKALENSELLTRCNESARLPQELVNEEQEPESLLGSFTKSLSL